MGASPPALVPLRGRSSASASLAAVSDQAPRATKPGRIRSSALQDVETACCVAGSVTRPDRCRPRRVRPKDGGQVVERESDPLMRPLTGSEFVVPASQVLPERAPGRPDVRQASALDATHRLQPCLGPPTVWTLADREPDQPARAKVIAAKVTPLIVWVRMTLAMIKSVAPTAGRRNNRSVNISGWVSGGSRVSRSRRRPAGSQVRGSPDAGQSRDRSARPVAPPDSGTIDPGGSDTERTTLGGTGKDPDGHDPEADQLERGASLPPIDPTSQTGSLDLRIDLTLSQ